MNGYDLTSADTPQEREADRVLDYESHYLLSAEAQLLQWISDRAPLPEVLNRICSALDSQIGSVVSLISRPGNDASEVAAIAVNAALFGLHTFWSEAVVAENDELLGALEMYCCVRRSPSLEEFQLIERARCLAAIAIQHHNEAGSHDKCCVYGDPSVRARVLEWPASMNKASAQKLLAHKKITNHEFRPHD